ncbi:hypothetical protein BOX15_Mlig025140g1, partial [Macrostomum lignano]
LKQSLHCSDHLQPTAMHELCINASRKRKLLAPAESVPTDNNIADFFPGLIASAKRQRLPLQDCQEHSCQLQSQHQLQHQLQHLQQKELASASQQQQSSASTVPKISDSELAQPSPGLMSPQCLALLRDFDLNWEYGPCVGVSRLQRWERAACRGLAPPPAVRSLVLAHATDPLFTECIWLTYAGLS